MSPAQIGIVDYGMGNRRSVEKALAHVGVRPLLSGDHDDLRRADGLIVPGVGAFPEAMHRLAELGLDELIRERVGGGVPTLGLCLGMQLAFDQSTELGGSPGLGLVPGVVRELRAGGLKVPHIGWSPVRWRAPKPGERSLLAGLPDESAFYHVHSYVAEPRDPADCLGTARHGERFVTAVARGSFWGVQFHPEKSSTSGLRLLANFAGLCARDDRADRGPGRGRPPGRGELHAARAGAVAAARAGGAGEAATPAPAAPPSRPAAASRAERRGGAPAA